MKSAHNAVRQIAAVEPSNAFVDTFVMPLTSAVIGIAELLIQESRIQEAKRKYEQRAKAVQLITDAIFEGRRITRDDISQYVVNAYMTKQELADKLDIPLEYLNASLKRWYHF